jgi:hypothetical protein
MGLSFNTRGFAQDIKMALAEEILELTILLETEARQFAPNEVDRSRITSWVTEEVNRILGRVEAGGVGALVTEHGSGSKSDPDNPAWDDYFNSEYYNPARPKMPGAPIMGRPFGTYKDLDGKTQRSGGGLAGVNMEGLTITDRKTKERIKIEPHEPLHWLEKVIELNRRRVNERLVGVIERFPMHQYIEDGR